MIRIYSDTTCSGQRTVHFIAEDGGPAMTIMSYARDGWDIDNQIRCILHAPDLLYAYSRWARHDESCQGWSDELKDCACGLDGLKDKLTQMLS